MKNKAILSVIFCVTMLFGALFGNQAVFGEEENAAIVEISALENVEIQPEEEVTPEVTEEVVSEVTEEVAPEAALEDEFPAAGPENQEILSSDARIVWQKNPSFLGDFAPDKIYFLNDLGDSFEIESVESLPDEGGNEINILAFTITDDTQDCYSFHLISKKGGKDWEGEFREFVSNFKK